MIFLIFVEYLFVQFVCIFGKGKCGVCSLIWEEVCEVFGMIFDGRVEDVQLGVFFMFLWYKEESSEELVGFIEVVCECL